MNEVPFTNNGKHTCFIGGQMIPAGETRMIDCRSVPGFIAPAEAVAVAESPDTILADVVAKILSHSINQLREVLPGLSLDELAAVEQAEQAKEAPRKGALEAIAAERIRRATVVVGAQDVDLDVFTELLAAMSDAELDTQDAKDNASIAALIDAEKQRRAVAKFKAEMAAFDVADLQELKATYADQPAYLEALDQLLAEKGA